ncbi:hypothetical protein GZ77_14085 [Endozoicomonas montiporae]|uniref:HPr domain-containing protein n=2 Tax=Endozoicomonas montiporae TaxID=1027273 RepID=A0A081N4W5_9GAMM|nr:HPr family phosphocarrier protein [Endozoicomonas montiporae]AMO57642.1 hypothetical protein EZMO1_3681 [Endozoicomonas montiporae CL-33]KEQ13484.1 hypothetical protein GZ77_14060 [Endozoicomonas montiporae]KEQ13488.1 hypothetical protein GZ77_14085 [Endozoicomonas montiporae]
MTAAEQTIETGITKPIYSQSLICHHPTSDNPEVLKGFALAMLKGEGYYSNDQGQSEFYEELLDGERILMTTVTEASHTGIAVVTTRSPVKYLTEDMETGTIEEKTISLFVAVSVTREDTNFLSLLNKIQSWNDDKLLTDRLGQATFNDVWANISGEKMLPNVASEYIYHKLSVTSEQQSLIQNAKFFASRVRKLDSKVEIRNASKGAKFVNAKSFTGLLSLTVSTGHQIEMRVLGTQADSEEAVAILKQAMHKGRQFSFSKGHTAD